MSITFGTLAILFFLIPGILARKSFFILPFDKRHNESRSFYEVGVIIIISFFIHYGGLLILKSLFPTYYVNFENLFKVFKGIILSYDSLTEVEINPHVIIVTQIIIWIISILLGWFFNAIIRTLKWDRKYRILRFGNSWYYYFSGESIEFPDRGGDAKEIDYICVDALVKTNNDQILYIGVLSDYNLSENGGLKSFTLTGAKRRLLDDDENKSDQTLTKEEEKLSQEQKDKIINDRFLSKYYTIPSNHFIIPYNESVVNLNFRYYADNISDSNDSDNTDSLAKAIKWISLAIIVIWLIILFHRLFNYLFVDEDEDEEFEEIEVKITDLSEDKNKKPEK